MPSQKTFRTKVKLAKAQKQNRYVSPDKGKQHISKAATAAASAKLIVADRHSSSV